MRELRTLLLDMELSYALGYFFPSKHPQYMHARQVKHHQFIVCAAYKWLHETSRYVIKITDKPNRRHIRDCRHIAVKLMELMEQADLIVAHNGISFDLKHMNTVFSDYGLGPPPEKKVIDTLRIARQHFAFFGNDLDSLSKRFGGPGKSTRPDWIRLTELDEEEIEKAARYCLDDVTELERVFLNIRPWVKRYPHIKERGGIMECAVCQSTRLQKRGTDWDGNRQYLRVKCLECGHNNRGKVEK